MSRATASLALLLAVLGACSRPTAGAEAAPPGEEGPPTATSAGYAAPPTLTGALRVGGTVQLSGLAQPGARVRLAAPDGRSAVADAARDGGWRLILPAPSEPHMYALSSEAGDRLVRAEGAVVVLPQPGPPALLARAGFAALPARPPGPPTRPTIVAVDFDGGGAAAVGGLAPPNARVQLSVDGQASDAGLADPAGRFALMGPRTGPLDTGPHRFTVQAGRVSTEATATLTPPSPLDGAFVRGKRQAGAWRVDWAAPGGGVQTTLVLDGGA